MRIEEAIRFIKQSYDFEDIRVQTYARLRNMAVLVNAVADIPDGATIMVSGFDAAAARGRDLWALGGKPMRRISPGQLNGRGNRQARTDRAIYLLTQFRIPAKR